MKELRSYIGLLLGILVLTSCSGIPTLPPIDSTIVIEFPGETVTPGGSTPASTVVHATKLSVDPTETPYQVDTDIPQGTDQPAATASPRPSATGTATASPTKPPTHTASPSLTASPRPTRTATEIPEPTATFTSTPPPTLTPTPFPYGFQDGSPYYLGNFAHPEAGCEWMGVAGQIFDQQGNVIQDVVVKAGGTLDGEPVLDSLSMPGAAKVYGPGGYEIVLSHSPAASEGEVWVQLFDLNAHPVSEKLALTTYDSCQKNLILLNFVRK